MSLNVIHVNDINLVANTSASDNIIASAGAAILHEDGLKIGDEAEALAKIFPRRLNDSYWQTPSAEPLKDVPKYARHHADLIYYQLKALHKEMGSPDEIILAVPSNMNSEQLSIVLGVAHPLPFSFIGLTDVAVASGAFSGLRGEILHYDLQRYQTVITLLKCDEYVERIKHLIIPNHGIQSIRDKSAAIIANAFIEQSRYDPMHAAQSEQTLYDRLPEWLQALSQQNDLTVELGNKNDNYQAKLERNVFIEVNDAFMNTLLERGRELSASAQLHIGNQYIAPLQALSSDANTISILPTHATFTGIRDNQADIINRDSDLPLVTRLKNATVSQVEKSAVAPSMVAPTTTLAPTHLLVDNTATALPTNGGDLSLHIVDGHLVTSANSNNAIAHIEHATGQFSLLVNDQSIRLNNKTPSSSVELESGDIISTQGGLSARLISVTS